MDIEKNRTEFLDICRTAIRREGTERLLGWLETTDFFEAPASTKYHLNVPGGLCRHSLNVHAALCNIAGNFDGERMKDAKAAESLAVCGLFHDICKTGMYRKTERNVKDADGAWVSETCYEVRPSRERVCFGHGEESVYILVNSFITLSREEALAIRWHMGGFDPAAKGGERCISDAFANHPLAAMLHSADLLATYVLDPRYEERAR